MEARMKCFHPACVIYKYGEQSESDEFGDNDMDDGPPLSAKLLRDQFRKENRGPQSTHLTELMNRVLPIAKSHKGVGRILIFDQWLETLDLVAIYLTNIGVKFLRIVGWMARTGRDKAVDDFHTSDSIRVMIVTVATGGFGLTLTAARWIFILTMG
jgi:SNF2 family DNA or RNA helicase